MKEEWKIRPYLGVFPLVLRALCAKNWVDFFKSYLIKTNLNKAFSAPRICTVDAGYLAKLVKLPA